MNKWTFEKPDIKHHDFHKQTRLKKSSFRYPTNNTGITNSSILKILTSATRKTKFEKETDLLQENKKIHLGR